MVGLIVVAAVLVYSFLSSNPIQTLIILAAIAGILGLGFLIDISIANDRKGRKSSDYDGGPGFP